MVSTNLVVTESHWEKIRINMIYDTLQDKAQFG